MTYHLCEHQVLVPDWLMPAVRVRYPLDCFDEPHQSHAVRRLLRERKLLGAARNPGDTREVLALYRLPREGMRIRGVVLVREPGKPWFIVGQQSHQTDCGKFGWKIGFFVKLIGVSLRAKMHESRPRPPAAHLFREVCSA